MTLQISTFECEREDLIGHGHVIVRGDGVLTHFNFAPEFGISKSEAERQAKLFVAAMEFVDQRIVEAAQ
ncbi:hypothetical protein [Cupriavidus sp. CuC1]|uniref:hypothetical protein n=1 Tax=Cupriavidus sp. CuC1 TaxID=3373131 RepID=UPI0037D0F2FD